MSDFVAVTYRQSEKFNLELVENDDGHFVRIWTTQHTDPPPPVTVPFIRVISYLVIEDHDDGIPTVFYILEVEDYLRFFGAAAESLALRYYDFQPVDKSNIIAFRNFCTLCLPSMLDIRHD